MTQAWSVCNGEEASSSAAQLKTTRIGGITARPLHMCKAVLLYAGSLPGSATAARREVHWALVIAMRASARSAMYHTSSDADNTRASATNRREQKGTAVFVLGEASARLKALAGSVVVKCHYGKRCRAALAPFSRVK